MKVLHLGKFFPPHRGGMETHLATLSAGLARHAEVEVVVAGGRRRSSEEIVNGVSVTRARSLGVVAATPICPSLPGLVRRSRADLIHIHHPHPFAMLAYLTSGSPAPSVITYQSDIVRQRYLGAAISPLLHAALRRSAAILVSSPNYLETSAVLRRYRHKCHVVPLGIDAAASQAKDEAAVARIRGQFGGRLVLAVGRLVPYKGFEYLVHALRYVDGHLVIIGSGPRRSALERAIAVAGLHDRVTLLGDVSDVQPYYHACDVFVLPSVDRSEAFGIVQLEAMAATKPVVNTDVGSGVTFVSPDGETGIAVTPADSRALADAINRLLNDPPLRERLGQAGRARVRAVFGVEAMVQSTLDVYRHVLGISTNK